MYSKVFKDLKVTKCESVLKISLDNENMSNAITDNMIDSIEEVLRLADDDIDIRCIVLTGEGKNFCAGGDIKAMESKTGMFAGESNELRSRYERGIQRIPRAIESLRTPIIAMVNGAAIGAGCDLAMMCDLRVSSDRSKFGETFSKLSLVPGDGGTFFLQRVIGYTKAMEMFLTGDIYSGDSIERMGLSNYHTSHDTLEEFTMGLANKISSNGPIAISLTKMALKSGRTSGLNEQLELLSTMQGISQRTQDHFEGINSFKEKRSPEFKGY